MAKGIRYKKDYLNEVIFSIDFSTISDLLKNDESSVLLFKEEISNEFPHMDIKHNNNVNVYVDFKDKKLESNFDDVNLTWIFTNNDNNKIIELNSEHLRLCYLKGAYEGFKEFLDDVSLVLYSLRDYTPFKLKGLQLRYINQINESFIDEKNIKEYINESLINNIILDFEDNEAFSQVFTRLDFLHDFYHIIFHYGFFNPNFPHPDSKKDFILDFSCNLMKIDSINSQEDIENELKIMNKVIYKKFDYAISEKMKDLMEVL